MKKYLSFLLAALLLLPGCGVRSEEDAATTQNAETILRVMLAGQTEQKDAGSLTWYLESSDVERYLTDCYKLEDLSWSDGAIVRREGAWAFELAVLRVDEASVDTVTAALQNYLLERQGSFTGYFPDQANMVENGLILTRGGWVALDVCAEPEAAKTAFESCFGQGSNAQGLPDLLSPGPQELRPDGRLTYKDPGIDDMTLFDSSAILEAWKSGDSSSLSREDRLVLEAAKQVLEQCVTPEMSDYEKELALYVWLTGHAIYDQSHYEKTGAPRTAYEPYGPLVDGKGVCLGFAEAFRLLMDMVGVECITVTGAAFRNNENHAWNMVKLNGEWYCADATWDLNSSISQDGENVYRYFNVTSDWLAMTDHQWDYDNTPEATAEDHGRPE